MSEGQSTTDPSPPPQSSTGRWARARAWWQREWKATVKDAQKAQEWSTDHEFLFWTVLYIPFFIICLCYAVGMFLSGSAWWPGIVSLIVLVAGTAFYLVTAVFPTSRRARDWIIQRSVAFITLLAMIVLGAGFILWLLVNFYWAAEEQLTSTDTVSLVAPHPAPAEARQIFPSGREQLLAGPSVLFVSAVYPNVALADATANQLRLNVTAAAPGVLPRTTLQARIQPQEWLAFPDARGREDRLFDLPLGPARPTSLAVALVNAQTYTGLRNSQAITVEVRTLDEAEWHTLVVPVVVEGTRGFAVRRFVNSTINENSPYIFALLLIAPGLAALTQKTIDQRYAELRARRQEQYKQLVKQIQEELRGRDFKRASNTLKRLKSPDYQEIVDDAPEIAEALLGYSGSEPLKADDELGAILRLAARWPNELVAAWLEARDNNGEASNDDRVIQGKEFMLKWDAERISDKTLQDQFHAAVAMDYTRPTSDGKTSPTITNASLYIPFQHTDARSHREQEFLFGGEAFCGAQQMVRKKRLTYGDRRSFIVFGQKGCGRTALACAFARKHKLFPDVPEQPPSLRVPLEGQPDMHAIGAAVMETLFAALLADSRRLEEALNVSQKETLADLMLVYLSYLLIRFEIQEAQKRSALSSADATAADAERKRADAHSLVLQQFKRVVEARNAAPPERLAALRAERGATPDGAYRAIAEVVRTLGYGRIVLVYDAGDDAAKWLRRMVFNQLDRWHARHTSFALFAPVAVYEALNKKGQDGLAVPWPANLEQYALVWSRKELTALAGERYVRFRVLANPDTDEQEVKRKGVIAHFKNDGSFDRLLTAAKRSAPAPWADDIDGAAGDDYSPRLFMEKWRAVVGNYTYTANEVISVPVATASGGATSAASGGT